MLLGEPPRSGGDISFQLFGIPVRVHPYFWLIAVLLGLGGDPDVPDILIWIVAVFVSILIHEMGHALVMRFYGGWPSITLYSFGGLASDRSGRTDRTGPLEQVLITLAGPFSQFALVAGLALTLKLTGHSVGLLTDGLIPLVLPREPVGSWALTRLLLDLMLISVYWGVLNLLPVYPLDGGQVAREILVTASPRNGIPISLVLSILTAAAVVVVALSEGRFFLALLIGMLGYGSYQTLQAYRNQRGW